MFSDFIIGMIAALFSPILFMVYIIFLILSYRSYKKNNNFVLTKGMKIVVVIGIILIVVMGYMHMMYVGFISHMGETSRLSEDKIRCAYLNIDATRSSWDEKNKIFYEVIENTGVYPVRLTSIVPVVNGDKLDSIEHFDDSFTTIAFNESKDIYVDLSGLISDGDTLNSVYFYTECESVYDSVKMPAYSWRPFTWNGEPLINPA